MDSYICIAQVTSKDSLFSLANIHLTSSINPMLLYTESIWLKPIFTQEPVAFSQWHQGNNSLGIKVFFMPQIFRPFLSNSKSWTFLPLDPKVSIINCSGDLLALRCTFPTILIKSLWPKRIISRGISFNLQAIIITESYEETHWIIFFPTTCILHQHIKLNKIQHAPEHGNLVFYAWTQLLQFRLHNPIYKCSCMVKEYLL